MAYTTIKKPSDYFRIKTFTGNGTNDTAITWDESSNMQPDFLWFKNRDEGQSHALFDVIRGADKRLISNEAGAEGTEATNLDSFDTNGFTVDNELIVNGSGDNMVTWGWKANGTGSANTDGTISSTVSANTTSGFSIVSYTGTGSNATIGHGLGVAPSMVITKRRSSTDDWIVWQKGLTNPASYLYLNSTNAEMGSVAAYQNITPTSTLLYPGTDGRTNGNGQTYISYCFAEKQGYSKFGSYTGNGNADGTFVYTGFKPAFVMSKSYTSNEEWIMKDVARDTFNPVEKNLTASSASSEAGWGTVYDIDILSNGFKMRDASGQTNGNGYGFIYMAFAEEPLVGDNPATAR